MHEAEGFAHGDATVYRRLDTMKVDKTLAQLVDAAVSLGFNGLNITHPTSRPAPWERSTPS